MDENSNQQYSGVFNETQKERIKPFIRTIALFLVFCMLYQDVISAAGPDYASTLKSSYQKPISIPKKNVLLSLLSGANSLVFGGNVYAQTTDDSDNGWQPIKTVTSGGVATVTYQHINTGYTAVASSSNPNQFAMQAPGGSWGLYNRSNYASGSAPIATYSSNTGSWQPTRNLQPNGPGSIYTRIGTSGVPFNTDLKTAPDANGKFIAWKNETGLYSLTNMVAGFVGGKATQDKLAQWTTSAIEGMSSSTFQAGLKSGFIAQPSVQGNLAINTTKGLNISMPDFNSHLAVTGNVSGPSYGINLTGNGRLSVNNSYVFGGVVGIHNGGLGNVTLNNSFVRGGVNGIFNGGFGGSININNSSVIGGINGIKNLGPGNINLNNSYAFGGVNGIFNSGIGNNINLNKSYAI